VEQQEIIALQECFGWQVTQQHLHRHQVDENQPLVAGKPIRAVAEGIHKLNKLIILKFKFVVQKK